MLRLFLYTYQIAKLLRAYLKETKKYRVLNIVHRSMLNYSNALDEHLPPSERASLMVAEEKPLPDSCKLIGFFFCYFYFIYLYIFFYYIFEEN
jgi:hypothetical protein